MSDDIIKRLREAIAAGPTRGDWQAHGAFNEWAVSSDWSVGGPSKNGRQHVAACFRVSKKDTPEYAAMFKANALYIAAASPDNIAALLDRLDAAEQENERLRADAERYRWLRGDACPDHSVRWTQWEVRCWVAPFWSDDLRREGLDRSIDAARAAERWKE